MDCTGPWRGAVERREWRLWVGEAQPGPEWGRYVGLVRNHKSGGRGGGHSRSSLKAWIRSKCRTGATCPRLWLGMQLSTSGCC